MGRMVNDLYEYILLTICPEFFYNCIVSSIFLQSPYSGIIKNSRRTTI